MKIHLIETAREMSAHKLTSTLGVGAVTAPAWINFFHGPIFQTFLVVMGSLLTITVVLVNFQRILRVSKSEKREERLGNIKIAILEKEAEDKGIKL